MAGPELEIGADVDEAIGEPVGADEVGATDTAALVPASFDDAQPATNSTTANTALTKPTFRRASIDIPFPINTWDATRAHTVPADR